MDLLWTPHHKLWKKDTCVTTRCRDHANPGPARTQPPHATACRVRPRGILGGVDQAASTPTSRVPVGLSWLAGTAVFGVTTSVVYATTGLGFPCPFRSATGWDCPFCGGTRMGVALMHLDVVAAFWWNPLALVGLLVATVLGGWLVVEWATGRRGRLAGRLRALTRRAPLPVNPTTIAVAALGLLTAWTLARNLLIGPLP